MLHITKKIIFILTTLALLTQCQNTNRKKTESKNAEMPISDNTSPMYSTNNQDQLYIDTKQTNSNKKGQSVVFVNKENLRAKNNNYTTKKNDKDFQIIKNTTTIRAAQTRLLDIGYSVTIDGVMGNETKTALATFQRENSIEPTGDLNSATLEALEASTPQN